MKALFGSLLVVLFFTVIGCGDVKYIEDRVQTNAETSGTDGKPVVIDADTDTDGDGLTDVEEFKLGTNPEKVDTDGGGVSDFDELANQTEPINTPGDDMCCSSPIKIELLNLEFIYDTDTLTAESQTVVNEIVEKVKGLSDIKHVSVTGHTDFKGADDYNQALSEKRANAIRDILISDVPLSEEIIEANGVGEMAPIATNDTEEGRQRNRRVEVEITF